MLSDSQCVETHNTHLQKQPCITDEWYIPGCFWLVFFLYQLSFQLCDRRSLTFTASPYFPLCLLIADLWNWVRSWLDSHSNYFVTPVKITSALQLIGKCLFNECEKIKYATEEMSNRATVSRRKGAQHADLIKWINSFIYRS